MTLSRISSSKPDTGKVFLEWNTKADGTGESYAVGDKMTMGGSGYYPVRHLGGRLPDHL